MKTFIVLALDTRKPKPDGTCSILLRIIHHRASSQITLGKYVKETDWDESARCIKSSYKGTESVTRLNNWLQKKKAEATDLITKLDEQKTLDTYTVYQIRDLIEKKRDTASFFAYGDSLVKEMIGTNRIGNATSYRGIIGILRNFNKGRDLSFQEVNLAFLQRLEYEHLKKGNTYNGLAVYMRTIRAIYNKAIKAGLVEQELYPFKNYSIKTNKTRKRAIRVEAIKSIQKLEIVPDSALYHARNYFLLSFYLRGMPYADLAHLKITNLVGGRVYYDRQKTGKPYDIKIRPEIQQILDIYIQGKSEEDFIFPIIKRETLEEQYKDIAWARKRYNKCLKDIAKLCGIAENLTSYVSRHSFATQAKNLGIPIASISDMMGHESIKTTQVYLDTLPSDLLDEYHAQIIK